MGKMGAARHAAMVQLGAGAGKSDAESAYGIIRQHQEKDFVNTIDILSYFVYVRPLPGTVALVPCLS